MPFSDGGLCNLKPTERPYKRFDGGGLFVQVNPSGSKLWHLKYRFGGKEKLLCFGPYPVLSLKDAREKRDQAKRQLLDGLDPSEQRKRARLQDERQRAVTFGGVAEEYLDKLRKEGCAPQTLEKQTWLVAFTEADLARRPTSQIEAPDILRVLRKVEGKGTFETARRLRSTIGAIFRYAIATGRARSDPTEALKGVTCSPETSPF
jgi:hypothetical protein